MATIRRTRTRSRRSSAQPLPFSRKLVLHQWLLGLFGVGRFDQLAEHLRDESLEGLDQDNIHRFHHALCLHLPVEGRPTLPDEVLLEHDQTICTVTTRLNERRIPRGERPIAWKYFQYLALLFTEIYLNRWFRDPLALLAALNAHVATFNEGKAEADRVSSFNEATAEIEASTLLNKLAFWMATGSGKTLLMHAHILQYRRLLTRHGRDRDFNRIILLTPNEGLSRQHLREFEMAGIDAEMFDKQGRGLFAGQAVEILEVTKLRDEMGDKTVAVDAFEGNNLVLIDEGHRGAATGQNGAWMRFRNMLCEKGFSFEYSATFGQAVKGNPGLGDLYARSTLFDYSYRWFYGDGFGKDYRILNLDDNGAEWMATYLTACLLAFFQQQRLFREHEAALRPFNLERPLWIFVGGRVTATLAKRDASDIIEILRFLARHLSDRAGSVARIREVLSHGLVSAAGENLFAGRFVHLATAGLSPEQVFGETLDLLFNAPHGGGLHIENLKGATGEVALRVGENEPFGVINVGDDSKLVSLCEQEGFNVTEREFAGSLFHELAAPRSTVNVLIGSRKFTEGWNSWRVGAMGLMNVGRGEGAQIIQLFGRGVRLKGCGMSLKRSGRAHLPQGLERPDCIEPLETLHVFGVRANYMAQFRDFLEEEGLPPDDERIEFHLPIIRNLGRQPLKTIRIRKTINGVSTASGDAFRKLGPVQTLSSPDRLAADDPEVADYLQRNQVVLNWYPKIQAMNAPTDNDDGTSAAPEQAQLRTGHIAFLDIDHLFFELERFKAERGWHNLNLSYAGINDLLVDSTWYRVLIPESELRLDSFGKVRLWQEIALALLKKYMERYYTFRKHRWELPHLEYRTLTEDDRNFPMVQEERSEYGYRILVEKSQQDVVAKLEELKVAIESGDLKPWSFQGLRAVWFDRHLYQPLLALEGGIVEIAPAPLNEGERRFVEDLKMFCDRNRAAFEDRELYLLRNMSRGRGIGFFEAGNFHPDFILWLLAGDRQHVTFVDPKGIRQIGKDDPKIRFFETIKEIEQRLGDPNVELDSFIVSRTPSHVMKKLWGIGKSDMAARHIAFQEEDHDSYIGAILHGVGST